MATEVDDELEKYAKPPTDDELEQYAKPATADEKPEDEERQLPSATPRLKESAKNFKPPTRFEKERPEIPEAYGFTPGNVLGNVYEGAKGVIGSTAQGLYDTILGEGKDKGGEERHGLGGLIGMNAEGKIDPVGRLK